jgi:hypothetical protein
MAKKINNPVKATSSTQGPTELNEPLVDTNRDENKVNNISEIRIDDEALERGLHAIESFRQQIKAGLANSDQHFSIHSIEKLLGDLKYKLNKVADDVLASELNKIDEQKLIDEKKKEFKDKGVILRTNAKSSKRIISEHGIISLNRYILKPKTEECRSKLLLLTNKDSIIPLDEYLEIDNLPFKITIPMMLEIAFWAQNQSSFEAAEKK